jgi:hypothetical protein
MIMANLDKSKEDFEEQSRSWDAPGIVKMTGKRVTVIPKVGPEIKGTFLTDKIRLRELSWEQVFVIEISPDVRAYIRREQVSFVVVDECGYTGPIEIQKTWDNYQ